MYFQIKGFNLKYIQKNIVELTHDLITLGRIACARKLAVATHLSNMS